MYIGTGTAMTYEHNHVALTPPSMMPGETSAYVVNESMTEALFMRGNTEDRGGATTTTQVVL